MGDGWVYVLLNSSLPGLAKVGRSFRPPAERAAELSASTGVPTPFVVAFDQHFADCCTAEQDIHAELGRRGLRVAANREFFRGSPSDIIRVVLEAADGQIERPQAQPAGHALVATGDRYLFGLGDTLQDTGEAIRCYKLAAGRGAVLACERLGSIYGQLYAMRRDRANRRRALAQLKEGVRRGNYYCYCELASLFAAERHIENFAKSWRLFFERRADGYCAELEAEPRRYEAACRLYIGACLDLGLAPGHLPELRAAAAAMQDYLLGGMDQLCEGPARRHAFAILRWVYFNLAPDDAPAVPEPGRRKRAGRFWALRAETQPA